jgi:hypothetical protein
MISSLGTMAVKCSKPQSLISATQNLLLSSYENTQSWRFTPFGCSTAHANQSFTEVVTDFHWVLFGMQVVTHRGYGIKLSGV